MEHVKTNAIWSTAIWVVQQKVWAHPVDHGVIAHLVWNEVTTHYTRDNGRIMGTLCKRGEAIAQPLDGVPPR